MQNEFDCIAFFITINDWEVYCPLRIAALFIGILFDGNRLNIVGQTLQPDCISN